MTDQHDYTDQLYHSLQSKDTDELLSIWNSNDHKVWSDACFIVVEQLLTERLGTVPKQHPGRNRQRYITQNQKSMESNKKGTLAGWMILVTFGWFMLLLLFGYLFWNTSAGQVFGFLLLGSIIIFCLIEGCYLLWRCIFRMEPTLQKFRKKVDQNQFSRYEKFHFGLYLVPRKYQPVLLLAGSIFTGLCLLWLSYKLIILFIPKPGLW
jgi:hypothetical protein